MDSISTWVMEAYDFFRAYIVSESHDMMLKKFIKYLEFPGDYELKYPPISAVNLILLKGDKDETYTDEELLFLENGIKATYMYNIEENIELNFFEIELNCPEQTKDLVSCALIKIFNKSFKTKNLFVFRCSKTIAIGSHYSGGTKIYDDFCLSKWYSHRDNLEELLELSYEYCYDSNIHLTLIEFSNEVMRHSHLLSEVTYIYGMNFKKQNHYKQSDFSIYSKDYRQLSDELRFIVPEDHTSYEYLELAQEVQKNSTNKVYDYDDYSVDLQSDDLKDFKEDAFNDAEKMLEYLDNRDS